MMILLNYLPHMISYEMSRKNQGTAIEMKLASSFGQKQIKVQKLGLAIKKSIQKLQRIKKQIFAESDVKNIGQLVQEYRKENTSYLQLQKSLAELDEPSPTLDQVKLMNRRFLENFKTEDIEAKLKAMKSQRAAHVKTDAAVEMGFINQQQLTGQLLAGNKHELRRKILQQQQQQIDQIDKLVNQIHTLAADTGNMILQQGMKLHVAASTMSKVVTNLKAGNQNLVQANQYQQNTNKKLFVFCCITVLVVCIVVAIMYASSKKSH